MVSCPQIRGLTGVGIVEVEVYICIANNEIVLKFTLVDRFSFPASNVSHFQRNKLYSLKKKKSGKRTAGPFRRRSGQTNLFSSPGILEEAEFMPVGQTALVLCKKTGGVSWGKLWEAESC